MFPQFARGDGWSSDFFFINQDSAEARRLLLSFFDGGGNPLDVTGSLGSGSSFRFDLPPGGLQALTFSATGPIQVGYAVLEAPLGSSVRGTEVFRFEQNGTVLTELGVPQQFPFLFFSLPVEVNRARGISTGLALAYPVLNVTSTVPQKVVVDLIGSDGTLRRTALVPLSPGGQIAVYLHEPALFAGLDNVTGSLSVSAAKPIGVLGLRQDQQVFGSLAVDSGPVLAPFFLPTTPFPEIESNDSRANPQVMIGSAIIAGRIAAPQDQDVFQFAGKADSLISAMVDRGTLGSELFPSLELQTEDGTVISRNDWNGLLDRFESFLRVALPADGTYYLRIRDLFNDGSDDHTYDLHLRFMGTDGPSGLPWLDSIAPNNLQPGVSAFLTLTGRNLSQVSRVNISPAVGFTIGTPTVSSGQVRVSVILAPEVLPGPRQVAVESPAGVSNVQLLTIVPAGN